MAARPAPRLGVRLLALSLLQLPGLHSAPFDVIGPPGRILAMVGEAAELPCRLSSNESAARMELRWFREPLSPAVLAHPAGLAQDAEQMAAYRGRAELVRDDIARGRVALRLRPVRASDAGEYRCAFRQGGRYAEARASLAVAALGSTPYIRMGVQESGATWLECTSVGWYPEPRVEWRTPQGEMFPSASESRSPDAQGLFKVVATVVITDSSMESVSCHIWNPLLSREKEAEISMAVPVFPRPTPWIVAVAVIVVVLGILIIGSVFFTWRLYQDRSRQRKGEFSSAEKLLEELKWKKSTLHAVDVTLDPDTAHPHLFLYEGSKAVRLEDSRQKLPEKLERFDSWPCVLGREAFSSGRHYWEVEVGDRTDWAIGVCREDVPKKGFDPMTPENGFWAVELYGNGYWALTRLRTPLPLAGPPRRVGVFLDYESGDISFYNTTDGSHIYTFPKGVTVVADAKDPSREIPLSPVGEDAVPGDTDALHSKLIPAQPSPGAP
uniref:Butyrophilin subfamily 1 member A1 n=1 Tax=Rousettus aegyptiacus TaxID=9407 RepID=A0A7J8BD65_ROUAE|nr:butyrophilin subfamily 1 member A1 [Rousettus aegyptiacus]